MPVSAKSAMKTAKLCRFCVLRDVEMPKTLPIMPIMFFTMFWSDSGYSASGHSLSSL